MQFVYNISTPANTPATSPVKTDLKLVYGLVFHVEIEFPPGPRGYLYLYIKRAGHPVFPANPNSYYHGDNKVVVIRDANFPMFEPPFMLECYTWNLSDHAAHEVIVRIDIDPTREDLITYDYLAAQEA